MKKMLIAENNSNDLSFYESALQKSDYCVTIATDAQDFLQRYKSELEHAVLAARGDGHSSSSIALPFDAVVLNHRVSDSDGLQAAREVLSVNPHQRVVFVSGSAKYTEELRREFYSRVDIIQKPFQPQALIELLESAELYKTLGKLGVNVERIKECNLYHFQLLDLLAACLTLLEAENGNGK
ncbi:MAG: response regulator [Nitrososphaera sp.]